MSQIIPPGSVVGVLGSGQLGRMFAIEARRMGYRVHTLSPDSDTPLGQVADVEITADYTDLDAVRDFAQRVDVVTFEFENVPSQAAAEAAKYAPVRPDGSVLHITQHRLREKTSLRNAGFPVTEFREVTSASQARDAAQKLGGRVVFKTAGWGYDGKGQAASRTPAEAEAAWRSLRTDHAICEAHVNFDREMSVVAARGMDGSFRHFGAIENVHRHGILHTSMAPAPVSAALADAATQMARDIMEHLQVVGVMCVEYFVVDDRTLLVNELAPRPHNSGHLTINACRTDQFEQQLRAVCGLPLGDSSYLQPAAMVNLLGEIWLQHRLDWAAVAALSDVKIHLYGKAQPRVGRKMGHLTALAPTPLKARERVLQAFAALTSQAETVHQSSGERRLTQ